MGVLVKGEEQGTSDVDLVGERFGKYFIIGEVAIGGMAEVFLAVQRGLEGFLKLVVLKRVLRQYSTDPEFVRLFIEEARIAARLEHPNVVRTYEFGEVDGQYFTAMEYLPGEDLNKVLDRLVFARQSVLVHVAAGIVSQVCAGLHFAHQLTDTAGRPLNLVHRDVNPANVVITYGGEVKLIDFGVAKTDASKTINSTIKGKVSYMSPEQLVARRVDARSDVFSTGIVLWELLAGRPLFRRDSEAATMYAIVNDPIPRPSRFRPDVPRALNDIVLRALARSPAERFSSAGEMGDALEDFLADQPKYDSRILVTMLEDLFGRPRAEAKRSIAQSRSLSRNVSLVMKLRTEVKSELVSGMERLAAGSGHPSRSPSEGEAAGRGSRAVAIACALVILACIGGGVFYAAAGSELVPGAEGAADKAPSPRASLQITSTPPGAAISIRGEPTGLKTPATLAGLTGSDIAIGLELPGYGDVTARIDVPGGGAIAKHFTLVASTGRLVITGLPGGAALLVDGSEFQAGDLVEVARGTHEVRIVVDGRTVVQQSIDATAGDQHWKFDGDALVRTDPVRTDP